MELSTTVHCYKSTLLRLWDCFLLEGPKVLFRFALAILRLNETTLVERTDTIGVMRHLKASAGLLFDVDGLIKVAFEDLKPFPNRCEIITKQTTYLTSLKERLKKKAQQRRIFDENEQLFRSMGEARGQTQAQLFECAATCESGLVWLCYGDQQLGRMSLVDGEEALMFDLDLKLDSRITCVCSLKSLLVLGMLTGQLTAYHTTSRKRRWNVRLRDTVLALCCHLETGGENKVFAALADGTVVVLENVNDVDPCDDPFYIRVGRSPVTSLALIDSQLWCACGNQINVLHAQTLDTMDSFLVSQNPLEHILTVRAWKHGLWVAIKGSSVLELWDHQDLTCKLLFDVRQNRHISVRKDDDGPLNSYRITTILPVGDALWVGTGEGTLFIYDILSKANEDIPDSHATNRRDAHNGRIPTLKKCNTLDRLKTRSKTKKGEVKVSKKKKEEEENITGWKSTDQNEFSNRIINEDMQERLHFERNKQMRSCKNQLEHVQSFEDPEGETAGSLNQAALMPKLHKAHRKSTKSKSKQSTTCLTSHDGNGNATIGLEGVCSIEGHKAESVGSVNLAPCIPELYKVRRKSTGTTSEQSNTGLSSCGGNGNDIQRLEGAYLIDDHTTDSVGLVNPVTYLSKLKKVQTDPTETKSEPLTTDLSSYGDNRNATKGLEVVSSMRDREAEKTGSVNPAACIPNLYKGPINLAKSATNTKKNSANLGLNTPDNHSTNGFDHDFESITMNDTGLNIKLKANRLVSFDGKDSCFIDESKIIQPSPEMNCTDKVESGTPPSILTIKNGLLGYTTDPIYIHKVSEKLLQSVTTLKLETDCVTGEPQQTASCEGILSEMLKKAQERRPLPPMKSSVISKITLFPSNLVDFDIAESTPGEDQNKDELDAKSACMVFDGMDTRYIQLSDLSTISEMLEKPSHGSYQSPNSPHSPLLLSPTSESNQALTVYVENQESTTSQSSDKESSNAFASKSHNQETANGMSASGLPDQNATNENSVSDTPDQEPTIEKSTSELSVMDSNLDDVVNNANRVHCDDATDRLLDERTHDVTVNFDAKKIIQTDNISTESDIVEVSTSSIKLGPSCVVDNRQINQISVLPGLDVTSVHAEGCPALVFHKVSAPPEGYDDVCSERSCTNPELILGVNMTSYLESPTLDSEMSSSSLSETAQEGSSSGLSETTIDVSSSSLSEVAQEGNSSGLSETTMEVSPSPSEITNGLRKLERQVEGSKILTAKCHEKDSSKAWKVKKDKAIIEHEANVSAHVFAYQLSLEMKIKIADKAIRCLHLTRTKDELIIISCSGCHGEDEAVLKWRKAPEEKLWTNEPVFAVCPETNRPITPLYLRNTFSPQASPEGLRNLVHIRRKSRSRSGPL